LRKQVLPMKNTPQPVIPRKNDEEYALNLTLQKADSSLT
jgi:hypothetical protein